MRSSQDDDVFATPSTRADPSTLHQWLLVSQKQLQKDIDRRTPDPPLDWPEELYPDLAQPFIQLPICRQH